MPPEIRGLFRPQCPLPSFFRFHPFFLSIFAVKALPYCRTGTQRLCFAASAVSSLRRSFPRFSGGATSVRRRSVSSLGKIAVVIKLMSASAAFSVAGGALRPAGKTVSASALQRALYSGVGMKGLEKRRIDFISILFARQPLPFVRLKHAAFLPALLPVHDDLPLQSRAGISSSGLRFWFCALLPL